MAEKICERCGGANNWLHDERECFDNLLARIAKLEAVVEAADEVVRISDREHDAWIAYRAARTKLGEAQHG